MPGTSKTFPVCSSTLGQIYFVKMRISFLKKGKQNRLLFHLYPIHINSYSAVCAAINGHRYISQKIHMPSSTHIGSRMFLWLFFARLESVLVQSESSIAIYAFFARSCRTSGLYPAQEKGMKRPLFEAGRARGTLLPQEWPRLSGFSWSYRPFKRHIEEAKKKGSGFRRSLFKINACVELLLSTCRRREEPGTWDPSLPRGARPPGLPWSAAGRRSMRRSAERSGRPWSGPEFRS